MQEAGGFRTRLEKDRACGEDLIFKPRAGRAWALDFGNRRSTCMPRVDMLRMI